jgi:hypothetical protein
MQDNKSGCLLLIIIFILLFIFSYYFTNLIFDNKEISYEKYQYIKEIQLDKEYGHCVSKEISLAISDNFISINEFEDICFKYNRFIKTKSSRDLKEEINKNLMKE